MKLLLVLGFFAIAGTIHAHLPKLLSKPFGLLQKLPGLTVGPVLEPALVPAEPAIQYIHHVQEVPYPVFKEVPVFREVIKNVDRPVEVLRNVPVDKVVYKDRIIEKPVQVVKNVEKIVEQRVEIPVWRTRFVEKPVQVIKNVPYEKIIEKTVHVPVETVVEVVKEVKVQKEKIVQKPVVEIKRIPFETIAQVPYDRFVHVPVPHEHVSIHEDVPVVHEHVSVIHEHVPLVHGHVPVVHEHIPLIHDQFPVLRNNEIHEVVELHDAQAVHQLKKRALGLSEPKVGLIKKFRKLLYTNPLLTSSLIGTGGAVLGGVAATQLGKLGLGLGQNDDRYDDFGTEHHHHHHHYQNSFPHAHDYFPDRHGYGGDDDYFDNSWEDDC